MCVGKFRIQLADQLRHVKVASENGRQKARHALARTPSRRPEFHADTFIYMRTRGGHISSPTSAPLGWGHPDKNERNASRYIRIRSGYVMIAPPPYLIESPLLPLRSPGDERKYTLF